MIIFDYIHININKAQISTIFFIYKKILLNVIFFNLFFFFIKFKIQSKIRLYYFKF